MRRIAMNIVTIGMICITAFANAYFQDIDIETLLNEHPNDVIVLMQAAEYFIQAASQGDKSAVKKCLGCLEKVLEKEPRNGEAMAYMGSICTIQAQYASRQQNKIELMQKAFAKLDKAVALYPNNPVIRLTRGTTYTNIPRFFNRLQTAVQDFNHVWFIQNKQDMHLPVSYWVLFHFNYGKALQASGDSKAAVIHFQKVLEIAPEHRLAELARRQIKSGE